MSKRRTTTESSLPLFDLPLQDEEAGAISQAADTDSPPLPPVPLAPQEGPGEAGARNPGQQPEDAQPMLFSPDQMVADPGEAGDPGEVGGELEPDRQPPLQDRLLGGLADLTLLAAVLGVVILATQLMGVPAVLGSWPPFLIFGLLFSFPYTVIPLAFWGQTPGMAWVGHIARSLDDEPLTFGQTTRRWIGCLLTVTFVGLPLLPAYAGRSLADRLSNSKTLQAP